jgi:hypothetical protein
MPDVTFVRFNQNHYVALFNKNIHVLLVASQILLASLLLMNHLVYFPQHLVLIDLILNLYKYVFNSLFLTIKI